MGKKDFFSGIFLMCSKINVLFDFFRKIFLIKGSDHSDFFEFGMYKVRVSARWSQQNYDMVIDFLLGKLFLNLKI